MRLVSRDYPLIDPSQWKKMGSFWSDFCCHDFNTALFLTNNKVPKSISSLGKSSMNEFGIIDNGFI